MLSATIPNAKQFASWVGRIKNTTIYIQQTLKRIVPLEHNIYVDKKKIYLVKDTKENVNTDAVFEACKQAESQNEKNFSKTKKSGKQPNSKRFNDMKNAFAGTYEFKQGRHKVTVNL